MHPTQSAAGVPVKTEKEPRSHDIAHTMLAVLFIALLIGGSLYILRPFLIALVWAAVVVVATWPALVKLQARLAGRRGLAVTLMTTAILLIVLAPMLVAVVTILDNVDSLTEQLRALPLDAIASPPAWVERIPLVGESAAERWRAIAALSPEERVARVAPHIRVGLQWFAAQAGTVGMLMLHFFLTLIIVTILYAKGEVVRDGIMQFVRRLAGKAGEEAAVLAGKAIRGVVLGVVVTALVQAAFGGLGLYITDVPAVSLLFAAMLILSLAQLGPLPVLIPATIWLFWSGRPGAGIVLLVFAAIAGTIDNVIRPVLIKKGVDLPLLMIFAGVVGGLIAFGVIGLFIGPVVLAVAYTLLKVWVSDEGQAVHSTHYHLDSQHVAPPNAR